MKRLTITLLAASMMSAACFAQTEPAGADRKTAKLVSRLYQMTYGVQERCKKAPSAAAAEFSRDLRRFQTELAQLDTLLKASRYFPAAVKRQEDDAKQYPQRETPTALTGECEYMAYLIRAHLDSDEARLEVKGYMEQLAQ